jgi:uncharacterized protein (TIGR03083 family)
MATRPVTFDPAALRASYAVAGTAFVELAGRVPDDAWDTSGLGEWTVRDLVGHTTRSFVTVSEYLAGGEGRPIELGHPFDYARVFRLAHADPAAITERGRVAGRELGEHPIEVVAERRDTAVAAVEAHPDDAPVATPAGTMRLVDYLPSRVFELVVHTDDLARALGIEHQADMADMASRTVATTFLAGIVAENDDTDLVLRALTGRGTLPAGFTAL